jgi:hypothetical protein
MGAPRVAAVEASQLLEVIWVSLLAGVVVTTLFSLAVLGGGKSGEARRAGRGTAATLFASLAMIAFLVFVAGVIFGVNVMLSKD